MPPSNPPPQPGDGRGSSQTKTTRAARAASVLRTLQPRSTPLWEAEQNVYNMMPTIIAAGERAVARDVPPPLIRVHRGAGPVHSDIPKHDSVPMRKFTSECVRLLKPTGSGALISVLRVSQPNHRPHTHVFLVHGFGVAGAYMFKVVDRLSSQPGIEVFVLDLQGWGRSSKPPCSKRHSVQEAEDIFVEPIYRLREHYGLDKIFLIGHSLGGYVSAVYAMRYAKTLKGLVLVSPIGFPKVEKERQVDLLEKNVSPAGSKKQYKPLPDSRLVLNPTPVVPLEDLAGWKKKMVRIYGTSKPVNIVGTPFAKWQLRASWPMCENDRERSALETYFLGLARQTGESSPAVVTGDRIALDLFTDQRGAIVIKPLEGRFVQTYLKDSSYSLMFIYGSDDWVAPVDGFNAWWSIYHSLTLQPGQRDEVAFRTLLHAGHHPFLDDTNGFVDAVLHQIQCG